MAAAPRLQQYRNKGPGGAETGGGGRLRGKDGGRRQIAERQNHQGCAKAAQRGLAFAADIEEPGQERQRHGEPGEHVIGRVEGRVADRLGVAERAPQQAEECGTRGLAVDQHQPGDSGECGAEARGGDQQSGEARRRARWSRRIARRQGARR